MSETPETITDKIYCCSCQKEVDAELTTGEEVYPTRRDLYSKNFYICRGCNGFVGTHTNRRSEKPVSLGSIATSELKRARQSIHGMLDPLWQKKGFNRSYVYGYLTNKLGYTYHTANINSMQEVKRIKAILIQLHAIAYNKQKRK